MNKARAGKVDDLNLGKVLGFMRLLWAVDHGLHSRSKRMGTQLGVTGPQRLVLRILGRYPGVSAGGLSAILKVHPSTLTGVLRRLEGRRLIHRQEDAADRRRTLICLTAAGEELDAQRVGTVEAAVRRALSKLPADELAAAERALAAVALELERDA